MGPAPTQNLQTLDNGGACPSPMTSMYYGQPENAGVAYGDSRSKVGALRVQAGLSFPDCVACRTLNNKTDICPGATNDK